MPGRIQVSQFTADCLIKAKKGAWLTRREDTVVAKGLGSMTTYWVDPEQKKNSDGSGSADAKPLAESDSKTDTLANNPLMHRHERLVGWMVAILSDYLRNIVSAP